MAKAHDMSRVRDSSGKVYNLSRKCDGDLLRLAANLEDYRREFAAADSVMQYRAMRQELGGKQCNERLCCPRTRC
ncbi:hypothetical protein ACFU8I_02855 [Streptomyces sp. NPDC057540]|uniref:hypothetical protein n=1 Tax=Streptomyces sp. NPDC057540 TaxID=3346160 RepID=UPI0036AFD091